MYFLILIFGQWVLLFSIKRKFCPGFVKRKPTLAGRVLHICNCIVFPDISGDWDEAYNPDAKDDDLNEEDYRKVYQECWRNEVFPEIKLMLIWHVVWNSLHLVAFVAFVGPTIIQYHQAQRNLVLEDETYAYNVIIGLMIALPLGVVVLLPALQVLSLYLYYNFGHPWCRLFKEISRMKK